MKKTTYGLPVCCQHCGNADRSKWLGDWTSITCVLCHKTTPYTIVKVEEIDPLAPTVDK